MAKTLELKITTGPHNGTREYRVPDPATGEMIGGQVYIIRSCLRRKRVICPVGRRAGKTSMKPFLWLAEQSITAGMYYAGIATAGHVKAYELFKFARDQLGGAVKDARGEPESQDRWIETHAVNPTFSPDDWIMKDPELGPIARKNAGKNKGGKIWFWSGAHPHYLSIQGFTHHFTRLSVDEAHQIHPGILRVVNPMLLDSGGSLDVTGIPDVDAVGNDWFSTYYEKGLVKEKQHRWQSISFPSYANPHLNKEALAEITEDVLTNDDFTQQIMATFVSGAGSVFTNIEAVFVLKATWRREQDSQVDGPEWWRALFALHASDGLKTWIYEADPTPGHNYAMTVDFAGRTRNRDATAIHIYDMTQNQMACAVSIRGMTSPSQLAWIEGIKDHYGANEVYGDETPEGAALMGYLRERYKTGVIGIKFSSTNKAEFCKRGVFLFEMAEVQLIDAAEIKNEFKKYRRITSEAASGKDGPVSYSHPPGGHDDHVSAFLQIAPSMVYGKRALEHRDPPKPDLIDKDGLLDLSALNSDLDDDLAEGEDSVRVRVPRR